MLFHHVYIHTGGQPSIRVETSHLENKRECPDLVFSNLEEVGEYLGITDSVRPYSDFDPFVKNYFEYEEGGKPIIFDRLKSALPYWRDVIKAPPSVLNVIEAGYRIDFVTTPPPCEFKNNKSALRNQEFVTQAVTELLELDVIEEVKSVPYFCSPLSVAENGKKLRLILDLSILNEYIVAEKAGSKFFSKINFL